MNIPSAIGDYQVQFVETANFIEQLEMTRDRLCVIDSNVWKYHGTRCLRRLDQNNVMILAIDEEHKCLATVLKVYDALMARAAKRNMTLISIGGGILQDITGFAASTLYRGINWLYVPTTLLAQADSCIGSKTSLNYLGYKNLIGTFYPPSQVYIYPAFLTTLERSDFFSGLGEIIKLHLMGGEEKTLELIEMLPQLRQREPTALRAAVRTSLTVKQDYIAEDEFDTGRRNLLNFGHCFGHALESASEFEIPHGQAVLVGILFANLVARNRRLLTNSQHEFLVRKVILDNIVVRPRMAHLNPDRILQAMKMDKKRVSEHLALIMMREDYCFLKVTDLRSEEFSEAIQELIELLHGSEPRLARVATDSCAQGTPPVTAQGETPWAKPRAGHPSAPTKFALGGLAGFQPLPGRAKKGRRPMPDRRGKVGS